MASKACQECRALISAFLDGEISGDENARMRQHLASCADCRATLDAYRGIGSAIRAIPIAHPPQHLTDAIFAQTVDAEPRRLFLITSRLGYSLAAVASVLLIFVVATYLIIGGYERGVDPAVASHEPANGQSWPLHNPVRIKFNKDMNRESVLSALGMVPAAEKDRLSMSWDGDTLVIGDTTPFKPETQYQIKITTDATDKWGNHLSQPFELAFKTTSSQTTVQTPTANSEPTATVAVIEPGRTPTRDVQQPTATNEPSDGEPVATTPPDGGQPPADNGNSNGNGGETPVAPVNPMPPTATPTTPRPTPSPTPAPTEPVRNDDPTPTATATSTATATPTVPPTATTPPTATQVPTEPATPTTSASPTPSTQPVTGVIGDVYWGDPAVRDRLGDATGAAYEFGATQLDFQRGAMLTDEHSTGIYVLKFGSGWDQFGIPSEHDITPVEVEPGLFIPGGAFGELWESDDAIEDALGYALTREPLGFTSQAQEFEGGVIIATPSTIYVIYNDFTWDWFTRGSAN